MPASIMEKFRGRKARRRFAIPEGLRVYAIGDVHGCLDQLSRVLDAIDHDVGSSRVRAHLVFLGDLVDRGPNSAGVIERVLNGHLPVDHRHYLMGNHEEVMLKCYDGAADVYGSWLQYGGVQTLESYGLTRRDIFASSFDIAAAMRDVVPAKHIEFLRSFDDYVRFGDYVFAHAGIRAGVPLEQQETRDLRWIRQGFLDEATDHGFMVVHGHTIVPEAQLRRNRIALDTGCYLTGHLSAVALESSKVRLLTARSLSH